MNKKKQPLVTVLLPVYNRESVVGAIKSIINQTYENLEILVIDNASTDNTVERIKEIKDERIRIVVNEKNIGQTASMNKGIDLAKGVYIARMDSDDLALPNRIERQVQFMEKNKEYGICGSWVKNIDSEDRTQLTIKYCTTDLAIRFSQLFFIGFNHPSVMIKTEVLRNNNLHYNTSFSIAQDFALWRDILKKTKGANIPEVLLYYRKSDNNASKNDMDTMIRESLEIKRMILQEYFCSKEEQNKMYNCLKKMYKRKKGIFDVLYVYITLRKLCKKHIPRSNEDYSLLKSMIFYQSIVYGVLNNGSVWAKMIAKIYTLIHRMMFLVGRQTFVRK